MCIQTIRMEHAHMNNTPETTRNDLHRSRNTKNNTTFIIFMFMLWLIYLVLHITTIIVLYQHVQQITPFTQQQSQQYYVAEQPEFISNRDGTYTISSGYNIIVEKKAKGLQKKPCTITILDRHTAATSGYCSYGKGTLIRATADDLMRVHVGTVTDQKLFEGDGYVSIIELNDNVIGHTEDISVKKLKTSTPLTTQSLSYGNTYGQVLGNTYSDNNENIMITNMTMEGNDQLGAPVYNGKGKLVGMIIGKNDDGTGVMHIKSVLQHK